MKFALGFVAGYALHSVMLELIIRNENTWNEFKRRAEKARGYSMDINVNGTGSMVRKPGVNW